MFCICWELVFWNRNVDESKIVMCFFSSLEIGNDFIVSYVRALEEIISSKDPQLIMCIVTNNRMDCYSAIKKKCCVDRAGELFLFCCRYSWELKPLGTRDLGFMLLYFSILLYY
jgi:hypothetical protein